MKRLLRSSWIWLACALLWCPTDGLTAQDLDRPPGYLPYKLEHFTPIAGASICGYLNQRIADVDGDGLPELVFAAYDYIQCADQEGELATICWAHTVDPSFAPVQKWIAFGDARDLDGDGVPEICATAGRPESGQWQLWILDGDSGRSEAAFDLPLGPDSYPDGIWDGRYFVMGYLPPSDATGHMGILLGRTVGRDDGPRGLLLIDSHDGTVIWEKTVPCNPARLSGYWVGDLDGNDTVEIAFVTDASGNRSDPPDNRSGLYVFAADGQLLWQKDIGPLRSRSKLQVCDLDDESGLEITVMNSFSSDGGQSHLTVFDGPTGECLARKPFNTDLNMLLVQPFGDKPGGDIFVALCDGRLQRFDYRRHMIEFKAQSRSGNPLYLVDMNRLPGRDEASLLVAGTDGRVLLLDRDFDLLGQFMTNGGNFTSLGSIWPASEDLSYVTLCANDSRGGFIVKAVPLPWWRHPLAIGSGISVLLGLAVLLWWRRPRRSIPRRLLIQLLRDLKGILHRDTSKPKRLIRFLANLNAIQHSSAGPEEAGRLTRESYAAFRTMDLEVLVEWLDSAVTIGFERRLANRTRRSLENLDRAARRALAGSLTTATIAKTVEDIQLQVETLATGLQNLDERLCARFTTDLGRLVRGNLDRLTDDLHGIRTEVTVEVDPPGAPVLCLVDRHDLDFVLDNLIANAIRALEGVVDPCLQIRVTADQDRVLCEVEDNGCGIAPDEQAQVFAPGFSSRPGGGAGLYTSADKLRIWGAGIQVLRSEPGKGTVFRMVLRRSQ